MGKAEERVRVVVVSPGDVVRERAVAQMVVDELNRGVAADRGCRLSLWRWEIDARPGIHLEGPQGLIDELMQIQDADVVVGVFWKRFGTPAGTADAGTEHELRRAWAAWQDQGRPEVMVYFCTRAYYPKTSDELAQWQRVLEFQQAMPEQQLWWRYTTVAMFERLLREHLTAILLSRVAVPPDSPEVLMPHVEQRPPPSSGQVTATPAVRTRTGEPGPPAVADPPSRELRRVSHDGAVRSVAFSADGTRLATAGDDPSARVTELETGRELLRVIHPMRRWHSRKLLSVALHPDGELIATAGRDHTARVRHMRDGSELLVIRHGRWVRTVSFSPDGEFIATAGSDGTARVWNLSEGRVHLTITSDKALNAAAFSHDSTRLATAGDDCSACVWDLSETEPPASGSVEPRWCVTHDDAVWACALSPDGTSLATASSDRSVRVWSLADERESLRLDHDGAVWSVAFSPDGGQVATAGADAFVRVWDLADRREVLAVEHDDVVFQVSFSPDGHRLATASADQTARVWKL